MTRTLMPIRTLRGFRDLLPDYMEDFRWVESRVRSVFERAGYREMLTPTVEPFELYEEKEGEQVEQSMFVFEDKGGRRVALRPELTASVARLFASTMGELKLPVKWYYVANMFRYEEPQKMRYREFWQAGAELIGASTPESDAEIVALGWDSMREVGLGDGAFIRLNNVMIVRGMLDSWGVPRDVQERVLIWMDKLGKVSESEVEAGISELIGRDRTRELLGLAELEGRDPSELESLVERYPKSREALENLELVYEAVKAVGIRVRITPALVRGLAYYTGTVFEVFVESVPYALGGGGRYDNLIAEYGGPSTPATGLSLGLDRIVEAVRERGVRGPRSRDGVYIAVVSEDLRVRAFALAQRLRYEGIRSDFELRGGRSLSKQAEYADKLGWRFVIFLGRREVEKGVYVVKDLESWEQHEVPEAELVNFLKSKLTSSL